MQHSFKEQLQQICLFKWIFYKIFLGDLGKKHMRFSKEHLLEHQKHDPSVFHLFAMGNDAWPSDH